jgi:hypothetical protein
MNWKNSHIVHCTQTAVNADVEVHNIFNGRNNITCSTDCKYKTAATLYIYRRDRVCFRYIVVHTVHKGNKKNNNNNNNNLLSYIFYSELYRKAPFNSYLLSVKCVFSFPRGSLTVPSNVFVKLKELNLFQIRRQHLYISNRLITGIKSSATSCNDER